jgi:hypothetical protein
MLSVTGGARGKEARDLWSGNVFWTIKFLLEAMDGSLLSRRSEWWGAFSWLSTGGLPTA